MSYDLLFKDDQKNVDMTEFDLSKMSEKDQADVAKIKSEITFDYESISQYGREVTKKLTEFSSQVLDTVKVKDSPEVENMLTSLVGELERFNTQELTQKKKKGILSFFTKGTTVKQILAKYNTVAGVIQDIKDKLEDAEYQLQKDIKTSEKYLNMNNAYIAELEKYILAADMKIREETEAIEEARANLKQDDTFAVQELAIRESDLKALSKRAFNLRLQRTIAIQNIPQLILIKEGDTVLVSNIDDAINQAIPVWESNIVIGILAGRQQVGAEISKSMSDTTNNILKQNVETLKISAINVAIENERDIVELETLKNTNDALIEIFKSVREVQRQGDAKREQSINELMQIQSRLNQALIESKE